MGSPGGNSSRFTYEERRGRESNPRIEVLQTPTLPLGYPAVAANGRVGAANSHVNVTTCGV